MKRTDIKTGVVYSYKTSAYDPAKGRRCVVLDTSTFHYGAGGGFGVPRDAPMFSLPHHKTRNGKQDWQASEKWGLLAVVAEGTGIAPERVPEADDAALLGVTLAEALAMTGAYSHYFGGKQIIPGGAVLLANPRYIVGEYVDIAEGVDTVQQERDRQDEEARAASRARVAATQARVDRLAIHGVVLEDREESEAWRGGRGWKPVTFDRALTRRASLTWAQVDALLSLIPEGAALAPDGPPDAAVDPDGWTLTTPPYAPTEENP